MLGSQPRNKRTIHDSAVRIVGLRKSVIDGAGSLKFTVRLIVERI